MGLNPSMTKVILVMILLINLGTVSSESSLSHSFPAGTVRVQGMVKAGARQAAGERIRLTENVPHILPTFRGASNLNIYSNL